MSDGPYKLYALACGVCGKGDRMARADEFAPVEGKDETAWCWSCMDHTSHRVPPQRCLVVWKEKPWFRR